MLIDLSNYVLETLREGEEYILYSGRRDGELPAILVVAPVSEYPLWKAWSGSSMNIPFGTSLIRIGRRGRWR